MINERAVGLIGFRIWIACGQQKALAVIVPLGAPAGGVVAARSGHVRPAGQVVAADADGLRAAGSSCGTEQSGLHGHADLRQLVEVVLLLVPAVVERLLLHERKDPDGPGGVLVRSRIRQRAVRLMVSVKRQPQLLEIVRAVDAPAALSRRLHRREQQGDEYGDDGNHHQQLHERNPVGATGVRPLPPFLQSLATHHDNHDNSPGHGPIPTTARYTTRPPASYPRLTQVTRRPEGLLRPVLFHLILWKPSNSISEYSGSGGPAHGATWSCVAGSRVPDVRLDFHGGLRAVLCA